VRARRCTLGALEQPGAGTSPERVDRRFSHAVDCTARGRKIVAIGLNYLDHIRESSLPRPLRNVVAAA
jgi:2-keto-4-pentenoate hydratase/2-oxohepta-3-ene-1,7-dioic acid hydratase in catechol pathway